MLARYLLTARRSWPRLTIGAQYPMGWRDARPLGGPRLRVDPPRPPFAPALRGTAAGYILYAIRNLGEARVPATARP